MSRRHRGKRPCGRRAGLGPGRPGPHGPSRLPDASAGRRVGPSWRLVPWVGRERRRAAQPASRRYVGCGRRGVLPGSDRIGVRDHAARGAPFPLRGPLRRPGSASAGPDGSGLPAVAHDIARHRCEQVRLRSIPRSRPPGRGRRDGRADHRLPQSRPPGAGRLRAGPSPPGDLQLRRPSEVPASPASFRVRAAAGDPRVELPSGQATRGAGPDLRRGSASCRRQAHAGRRRRADGPGPVDPRVVRRRGRCQLPRTAAGRPSHPSVRGYPSGHQPDGELLPGPSATPSGGRRWDGRPEPTPGASRTGERCVSTSRCTGSSPHRGREPTSRWRPTVRSSPRPCDRCAGFPSCFPRRTGGGSSNREGRSSIPTGSLRSSPHRLARRWRLGSFPAGRPVSRTWPTRPTPTSAAPSWRSSAQPEISPRTGPRR